MRKLRESVRKAQTRAHNLKLAEYKATAANARKIWESAEPASNTHPYISTKRIHPNNAREQNGSLVLPIKNFADQLTSLQFIAANGKKLLMKGGRKKNCFIHVAGSVAKSHNVIICEGWATGCTVAVESPDTLVIAAIDANNLLPVAQSVAQVWPDKQLVVAGDDDRLVKGNPGRTKANEAAAAAGGLVLFPKWPDAAPDNLSDFNDLYLWLMENHE